MNASGPLAQLGLRSAFSARPFGALSAPFRHDVPGNGQGPDGRAAVAFNAPGRDFDAALAITAFFATAAPVPAVGPLIEVPIMLTPVWFALDLRRRLLPAAVPPEERLPRNLLSGEHLSGVLALAETGAIDRAGV
jgi:hypothetical protein